MQFLKIRKIAGTMYDAGQALENASAMVRPATAQLVLLLWETEAKLKKVSICFQKNYVRMNTDNIAL